MWSHHVADFSQTFYGMPMGFIGIIFFALLVFIIFKIFTRETKVDDYPERPVNKDREDSLHILQVRLAKGEIDVEEFEKLKSYL